MPEGHRLDSPDEPGGSAGVQIVHASNEGRGVLPCAPDAWNAFCRPAGLRHPGQLGPSAHAVSMMLAHGQNASLPAGRQDRGCVRGHAVAPSSFPEQIHGGQSVQHDRHGAQVAPDPPGDLSRSQPAARDRVKKLQVGRRREHARFTVAACQSQDFASGPIDPHGNNLTRTEARDNPIRGSGPQWQEPGRDSGPWSCGLSNLSIVGRRIWG